MTYNEILDNACALGHDSSDKAKSVITIGINKGLRKLRSKLKRTYTLEYKTFSYSANEPLIQLPEDCIRPSSLYYIEGGVRTPLTRIDDENEWDMLKERSSTGRPEVWRVISSDIIEVYPVPSSNVVDGGLLRGQFRARPLSQLDITAGTVSVTLGSNTVTGSGTNWTTSMIGRSFRLADGNGHIDFYKIIGVASTTSLTLENSFAGATATTLGYKIGEVPNIPEEYHDSLTDMGLSYFNRWRKDPKLAAQYQADFLEVFDNIDADYSGADTSSVIESRIGRDFPYKNPLKRTPRAIS